MMVLPVISMHLKHNFLISCAFEPQFVDVEFSIIIPEDSPAVYGLVIVLKQETGVLPVVDIHAKISVINIFDVVAELHKKLSIVFMLVVQFKSQFVGPNITRVTPSSIEKLFAPRVTHLNESMLFA